MAVLEELDEELPVPPEDELVEMDVSLPEMSTRVSCEAQRTRLMAASVQVKVTVQAEHICVTYTSTPVEVVPMPVCDSNGLLSPSS